MTSEQQTKLLKFYNYIWNSGLPHQWRESVVIPLPKPGKCATDPLSYRPIALTNCSCKIMEKMVNWRLQAYLEENALLRCHQSGFRSFHTTTDALVRLEHSVRTSIIKKEYCIAVFLDISQAFDTVWHHGLTQKIHDLGLMGNLPYFLCDFLKMRKLSVRIGSTCSNQYPVHSGVPQGSVLSPTLFNIMINDIFDGCNPAVQTSLYADDGALWLSHHNLVEGLEIVQEALDQVHRWSQMWGLQISAIKSKAILFTNKRPKNPNKLTYEGNNIDFCKNVKFLGMTLDRRLAWQPHINNLKERCSKDQRLLRIISANNWGADFVSLRRIYCALIRSKVEYAGFLLDTAAPGHLKTLDKIQFAAVRTMLGALRCTPTNTLEAEADLIPLRYRRQGLLATYATRVLSIKDHPVQSLLHSYCHYKLYRTTQLPKPIAGRITETLEAMKITRTTIAQLPLEQRYTTYDPPCFLSLATAKKSDLRNSQWCTLYTRLQDSSYSNRTPVFCDGSVQGERSGCGVWSKNFNMKARLPNNVSIFTAELTALLYAITYIQNLPGLFAIYTDSYSSINALKQLKISNNYIISRILKILEAMDEEKVVIEWVPSHVGIKGNEAADTLATESVNMRENSKASIPLDDLKKIIKNKLSENWQDDWSGSTTKLHHLKPILGPTVKTDIDRKHQVCLSRLRLGTCMLTHGHHITKTAKPMCQTCHCNLTLQHAIVDCPAFVLERRPMIEECFTSNVPLTLGNILSEEYSAAVVVGYLEATQLLKRI
jgi:ribonuclease HI